MHGNRELRPLDDRTQAKIRSHLLEHLGSYYPGLPASRLGLAPCRRRNYRWSVHLDFGLRVDGTATGNGILVKVPHGGGAQVSQLWGTRLESAETSAIREYEALTTLHRNLAGRESEGLSAVRPLDLLPDPPALVVEKKAGRNLLELAREAVGLMRRKEAVEAARLAGRLLRAVHAIDHGTHPRTSKWDPPECATKTTSAIEMLERLGVERRYLRRIEDAADREGAVSDHRREDVVRTYIHGDYYPENVVIGTDGSAFTVDTTLHQVAIAYEDVAKLYVGLDAMKGAVLWGRSLGRGSLLDCMKTASLDGYFGGRPPRSAALDACLKLALLRRWCEIHSVVRSRRPDWIGATVQRLRVDPFMMSRFDALTATRASNAVGQE